MGRHKKRSKRDGSSSSSSSSGDDRRSKRRKRTAEKLRHRDERIEALESLVRQIRSDATPTSPEASGSASATSVAPTPSTSREICYIGRNDAVPEFDPQKSAVPIDQWIRNIESIATMYGWDERTIICNCTSKLRGYAKNWYERLEDYDISWSDWKARLSKAFPFTKNKSTMLRSLVNDVRRIDEDPIKFYYEKLGLGMSCGLPDDLITETIIGTIGDKMIEVGAVSAGCRNTTTLLSYLGNIHPGGIQSEMRKSREHLSRVDGACYICGRKGHKARTCRSGKNKPRNTSTNETIKSKDDRVCNFCHRIGHLEIDCYKKRNKSKKCSFCEIPGHTVDECRKRKKTALNVKNIMTLCTDKSDEKYYKKVEVNDEECTAYVDFGSACNTMKQSAQERLCLDLSKAENNLMIKGYGGSLTSPLGMVRAKLKVDGVIRDSTLLVVPDKMQKVDVMVGQPFTESENILVIKSNKELCIFDNYGENVENIFENTKKITLNSAEKVTLTPGVNKIEVYTQYQGG